MNKRLILARMVARRSNDTGNPTVNACNDMLSMEEDPYELSKKKLLYH